ncbi:MAG: RnfABCDGE type electron transport complex subunit G [Elusimicrobia bacterium]|nr:RnfABCDGE type electron transport complex subunit G [Elusimicrobiota bacterium]
MAKLASTFFNMFLSLLVVSSLSAGALGFVYSVTRSTIETSKLKEKADSLRAVLPDFDNDPLSEKIELNVEGERLLVYSAKKAGQDVGLAVETRTLKGYAGEIVLLAGLLPDGKIVNVVVLGHKETPGLGAKIDPAQSPFLKQFQGRNFLSTVPRVRKDGGDVDAITAATVSSRAVCDAIQKAYAVFKGEERPDGTTRATPRRKWGAQ